MVIIEFPVLEKAFKEIIQFIRELYKIPKGFIPLHAPVFPGNAKKYLGDCIDSTYVSSVGKYVDRFEDNIAKYTGSVKAVACVNGTSALHLALKLCGVETGNEVITQPLTFIATANAITYCNANPVFVDVDIDTLGLSPAALKRFLTDFTISRVNHTTGKTETINKKTGNKIAACVPMHTFGNTCRIDEIIDICNQYHLPVIEDAAESLGSFYKNNHTGSFGLIGILSFNGNKILTTGGGGMLLFNNLDLAERAKHLSTQAKVQHKWDFFHDQTGYNYRMPNINAALGVSQLENLQDFIRIKREIASAYKNFFENLNTRYPGEILFIVEPVNGRSNYWLNSIMFRDKKSRDYFLAITNKHEIMTRPPWILMNKLPMYENCISGDLSNAKIISARLVNLPSSVINNF